jgi:hypothetical protein
VDIDLNALQQLPEIQAQATAGNPLDPECTFTCSYTCDVSCRDTCAGITNA